MIPSNQNHICAGDDHHCDYNNKYNNDSNNDFFIYCCICNQLTFVVKRTFVSVGL